MKVFFVWVRLVDPASGVACAVNAIVTRPTPRDAEAFVEGFFVGRGFEVDLEDSWEVPT